MLYHHGCTCYQSSRGCFPGSPVEKLHMPSQATSRRGTLRGLHWDRPFYTCPICFYLDAPPPVAVGSLVLWCFPGPSLAFKAQSLTHLQFPSFSGISKFPFPKTGLVVYDSFLKARSWCARSFLSLLDSLFTPADGLLTESGWGSLILSDPSSFLPSLCLCGTGFSLRVF